MSEATEHYERLLAAHYTWMFGASFDDKVAEQKSVLAQALKSSQTAGLAVDLGSGPGFQSIALAQLGFSPVVAIDSSAALLGELQSHAGGLAVRTELGDLRELSKIVGPVQAAVVVCMGDTLTHLTAKSDVTVLFQTAAKTLIPGGILVLTWRDLTAELHGVDRFIPVRSDENTIMTCFLEYEPTDSETVAVHDLVYSRGDGGWSLNKSSYRKLRLSPEWVSGQLTGAGLVVESQGVAGRLLQIVARRP